MELATLIAALSAAGPAPGLKGTGSAAVERAYGRSADLVKQQRRRIRMPGWPEPAMNGR